MLLRKFNTGGVNKYFVCYLYGIIINSWYNGSKDSQDT